MSYYFDRDIKKMQILKGVKCFTLALTIIGGMFTAFCTGMYGSLEGIDYPITKAQMSQLVEIAKKDEAYKKAYETLNQQYREELASGIITQQQYDAKMEALESHEFINRVVNSAKTHAINQKVENNRKFVDFCGKGALCGVVVTAGSAGAYIATKQKREKIKRKWFSESDGRGL